MKLSKSLLTELQKRLKVGNRRGVHLNAIPRTSTYKLDLNNLSIIDKDLPDLFIDTLQNKSKFNFEVSWRDIEIDLFNLDLNEQKKFVKLGKSFENILNQVETIKSEKGIETFGFGFPLLIRRDRMDKKLTIAPLIIWQLELRRSKKNDTWEIIKNEDSSIYINEVLINHLKADSNIDVEQLPSEMLDDGIISKDELLKICFDILEATNIGDKSSLNDNIKKALKKVESIITEKDLKEMPFNDSNALITCSGLFSYFEIQKNNIIKNYDELLKLAGEEIVQEEFTENVFQSITSIPTDPTQQDALSSIETVRDLVIQGPPGTGKSQTLTAILVNALENKKKTLVVCEKSTALEVLLSSLKAIGLDQHTILIHDIASDRKVVVNSVRDRLQNMEVLKSKHSNSKFLYDTQIKNVKTLIKKINKKHELLDSKIIANHNWTAVVGLFLKQIRASNNEDLKQFPSDIVLNFDYEEYTDLGNLMVDAERLYRKRVNTDSENFIAESAYNASNFYSLEDKINVAFISYKLSLDNIKTYKESLKDEYFEHRKKRFKNEIFEVNRLMESFRAVDFNLPVFIEKTKKEFTKNERTIFDRDWKLFSEYRTNLINIWSKYKNDSDFVNEEKINGVGYKINSFFSNSKKQTIIDLKEFDSQIVKLNSALQSSNFFDSLAFENTITSKLYQFLNFHDESEKRKTEFEEAAIKIFDNLGLDYLNSLNDQPKLLEHLNFMKGRSNLSNNEMIAINEILKYILHHFSEQKKYYTLLQEKINNSFDLAFNFDFVMDQVDNSSQIQKIKKRIKDVLSSIESTIDFEFLNADVFADVSNFDHLSTFENLKGELEKLNRNIYSENLLKSFNPPQNLNSYINYIENFLFNKEQYVDKNTSAFNADYYWFNFVNNISDRDKRIINAFLDTDNWSVSFSLSYLNKLLRTYASDDLPTDQHLIDDLSANEKGLNFNQINFINDLWYNEQNLKISQFDTLSSSVKVKNLYNFKTSTGHRRYSLRTIIERDIDLFTTLFPIILTTPDIASNLFKCNNRYFDIVLFDESSQLRLEDNLPAMLKGKQIVIAGDEHQMPPSNYFAKIYDGDIENEEELIDDDSAAHKDKSSINALALSCASLLEFGSEMNFKTRYLDFHYRSQHPYLIDFSNTAFYNGRLNALPEVAQYNPISYFNVQGTFENSVNEREADAVISILQNNINRWADSAYPTVGVATFNLAQRDLIKRKIIHWQKLDDQFNAKIVELEAGGLFVKNLENIQGDERDIIIISTTYGRDSSGKPNERFGPINFEKGYKLLNVIITRAKYKNYIITSIPEEKILDYKSYLLTQKANNKKAVVYAYLAYAKGVSEQNGDLVSAVLDTLRSNSAAQSQLVEDHNSLLESPFEEEVYELLSGTIEKQFIIPQYKVGGFRIDLVVDFKIIGVPKIAIECDGAKYHSSSQAYLYDLHRQRILESQGFVFHRIWGTNWWRNSKLEFQKLTEFILEIKNKSVDYKKIEDLNLSETFNDDPPIFGLKMTNEELELDYKTKLLDTSSTVVLGSNVKIRFQNDNECETFQLVKFDEKNLFISDSIKAVSIESPLGRAILNKSQGDFAKIDGLDRYFEILEVD